MGDTVLTYDQFADAAGRVAAGLEARGVRPGDRVGMLLPNMLSFPILYYGALMAGAAVVPMNPLLKAREIQYYLRDSGARLVVAAQASAEAAAEAAGAIGIEAVAVDGVQPDALMAARAQRRIRLPGPTTTRRRSSTPPAPPARRKAPSSPTRTCRATLARQRETLLEATPDDVIMGCLPLFHVFGLTCGLNAAVLSGASLTLIPRFDGGSRAVGHRAGPGHDLRGCPDDVLGDAARARRGQRRRSPACGSASRAARRCRSRSCARSSRRSAASCSRATA